MWVPSTPQPVNRRDASQADIVESDDRDQKEALTDRQEIEKRIAAARRTGETALSEPEAKAILALAGIAVPRGGVAPTAAEAGTLATELGGPLALKVVSRHITHKSDVGGVELSITGATDAMAAWRRIDERVRRACPGTEVGGVLVEEMATASVEAVVSLTRDPRLGPVVMVGLGGLWVEILRDVAFRLAPVDRVDVEEMLEELTGAALLGPVRGRDAIDRSALIDSVLALSRLGIGFEDDIEEIEINPLALSSSGVTALDAVMRLRSRP